MPLLQLQTTILSVKEDSECEIEQYATRFEYMKQMTFCYEGGSKLRDETCNAAMDSSRYVLPPKRFEVARAQDFKSKTSMSEAWSKP